MKLGDAPCVSCTVRRVTDTFDCRRVCRKYLDFRKQRDERNAKEKQNGTVTAYQVETMRRLSRRKNK